MHILLNGWAGFITMIAGVGSLVVAGRLAGGDSKTAMDYLPWFLGGSLIVLDLLVRCLNWRGILRSESSDKVWTRPGTAPLPNRRLRGVLEAAFSDETGGQYFHILPVWLIGFGVIVANVIYLYTQRSGQVAI